MVQHFGRVIDHVHLRVRDLSVSRVFYRAICDALGLQDAWREDRDSFSIDEIYVDAASDYVSKVHLAFQAKSHEQVGAFHTAAVAAGGTSNGDPVFAPTFSGEGVVRSDDITKDPRYGKSNPHFGMPKGHLPVRSYLAVPVTSRSGEVIGGLFFGHGTPGVFRQEHEDFVSGIAGIASVAVDNARLFQALDRELAERTRAEELLQQANTTLEDRVSQEIAERLHTENALRQSQKMEAIGQLTGGVAHDFNNLLQVVSGNLQLLGKDIAGNAAAEKKVLNALEGVARGSKLASQLLSFGRRQALEPKIVNIGRFVAGMEDMLRRTIGEGIEIETIRSGGLWNTFVDVVQVENAILNLAINARDAMDGAGRLTIEVGNASLDDDYTRQHDDVEPGQYVMLAVTDTGSGMPADVIAKVYDPFFTTKPLGKGTGLGLSMVYGFVKQSGGHIKIYSELGEGTTVKIYFPRSLQQEDVVIAADHGRAVGGSETVLVAEDDCPSSNDLRLFGLWKNGVSGSVCWLI